MRTMRRMPDLVLVLFALISSACGGGGGGDSSGGSSDGPANSGTTLEVFQASLDAIDPAAPGTVLSIDPEAAELDPDENPVGVLPVLGGTFADGRLVSAQVEWVVYPREDGTLQRVSTEPGVGVPVPVRVSSEDTALPYCDAHVANDLADPTNARLAYATGGTSCAESLDWHVVTLSDDEVTDPRDFPGEPIEALADPTSGAHLGWLVLDGGDLRRLNPDLSVASAELATGIQQAEVLGATNDGMLFLEFDQALFAFDPVGNELIDLDFEFEWECSCRDRFVASRRDAFLVDAGALHRADARSGRVQRYESPNDALGDPDPSDFVVAGRDRIAWSYIADGDGDPGTVDDRRRVIRSIGRDRSGARTLDRYEPNPTPLPSLSGFVAAAGDEWVFYNSFRAGVSWSNALAVELNGCCYSGSSSLWVGQSTAPVAIPGQTGPTTRLFILSGFEGLPGPEFFAPLRLRSRDPAMPTEIDEDGDEFPISPIDLGQFDRDVEFAYLLPGFGPNRVGMLLADDGTGHYQSDLFYVHDETEDSLVRVTETDAVSEAVIEHF